MAFKPFIQNDFETLILIFLSPQVIPSHLSSPFKWKFENPIWGEKKDYACDFRGWADRSALAGGWVWSAWEEVKEMPLKTPFQHEPGCSCICSWWLFKLWVPSSSWKEKVSDEVILLLLLLNRKPTFLKVNQQPVGSPHFLLVRQLIFPSRHLVADHLLHLFSHWYDHLWASTLSTLYGK